MVNATSLADLCSNFPKWRPNLSLFLSFSPLFLSLFLFLLFYDTRGCVYLPLSLCVESLAFLKIAEQPKKKNERQDPFFLWCFAYCVPWRP